MSITCAYCLTSLPDQANYCLNCGKPVAQPAKQTPAGQPRSTRGHPWVFAIANQKGRVGKTTTAINLGACLASIGRKTLIVDVSPSAEATTGLGIDAHRVGNSIYELLVNDNITVNDVLRADIRPNLSLIPAKVDLYAADMELIYIDHREFRLKRILDTIKDTYDYVLIDCPSWLTTPLCLNPFVAADGVILPLPCEYFALEGLQQLLNTIKLVRDRLNPKVFLFGVVLTMYDPRTRLAAEVVDEITQHFPKEKFQSMIPMNVRLSEAPTYGLTILEHEARSPGATAYRALAEEVIERANALLDAVSPRVGQPATSSYASTSG